MIYQKHILTPPQLQGWLTYPQDFDPSKKYPLAFLIHGGPEDAWADTWNQKWHSKVFADQGYVVVQPNPTGSTGFGQQLTDAIQLNWSMPIPLIPSPSYTHS